MVRSTIGTAYLEPDPKRLLMTRRILGVNAIRLVENVGGVGRVIEAILNGMDRVSHPFDEIKVYSPAPISSEVSLPASITQVVVPSWLPPAAWEQFSLPAAHGSHDLLLCPSYVAPIFARCPMLLIHHGSYEGVPIQYSFWRMMKARIAYQASAHRAPLIATVSEHSKKKIEQFYGVSNSKVVVVPNGVDRNVFRPIKDLAHLRAWRQKTLGADQPFIVYVGRPDLRRNTPNLINAFAEAKHEYELPHKLVFIGTSFQRVPLDDLIEQSGMQHDIVCIPYASHDEIATAFNAAEMSVYPSLYEGFGMPVLEAMACGAPTITMNNTAFPEFAGGAAILLDNADVSTLKSAMVELHNDPGKRHAMSAAGIERARAYDWDKITKKYVELMSRLI